jgi:O-antigen ligase
MAFKINLIGYLRKVNLPLNLLAFGLVFSCIFYSNLTIDQTLYPRIFTLSIFILIILVFKIFSSKKYFLTVDFINIVYICFIILSLISINWSINKAVAISESLKTLLFLYVFLIAHRFNTDNYQVLSSAIQKSVICIFILSFFVAFFQIIDLQSFSRSDIYSVVGLIGHKNLFSSFIFLCSIFTLLVYVSKKGFWRRLALVSLFLQVSLVILLQTRTVWLGYIVFISVFFLFWASKKYVKKVSLSRIIYSVIISIALTNLFFGLLFPRSIDYYLCRDFKHNNITETVADFSTLTERAIIWDKTYRMLPNRAFLGVGANNWKINFPNYSLDGFYRAEEFGINFQRPHNDFLWILSEYGFFGFNLYLLFLFSILFLLFFSLSTNFNFSKLVILSGIIGYLCISFFDFPKERVEHNILFTVLLGFAYYTIKSENLLRTIFAVKIGRVLSLISIPILLTITCCSFQNIRGEYFTKKLIDARLKRDHHKVIRLSTMALSNCYNLDPTSTPIHWYRGTAYAKLKNNGNALSDLKTAHKLHPYSHYVLNDLGTALVFNNEFDKAKDIYKKAASISPRFDQPKLNLIALLINEHNYQEALKWDELLLHDSERRDYYKKIIEENLK